MFSIVHRVFLEYLLNSDAKQKAEMFDLLAEHLVHIMHTREGSRIAMQCMWNGDAKMRKRVLKSMKSFMLKIANDEHGHMVLLAIFDSVDDTKLVAKLVIEVRLIFNFLFSFFFF
jgi:pumilio homology domain family member 6